MPTPNYLIKRRPRVRGAETMNMPSEIGIDMAKCVPPLGGPVDIMFSPSGALLGGASADKMIFFIRDMGWTNHLQGDPNLIVVYTRSGLIASYPVNKTPGQEYTFVK